MEGMDGEVTGSMYVSMWVLLDDRWAYRWVGV